MIPDPEQLRMTSATATELAAGNDKPKRPPRHRPNGEFLRGPIPLSWLTPAARLPGRTLALALALWFQSGRTGNRQANLTSPILARFGVNRKALYRGLQALEMAGLVRVDRRRGKNPAVEILDAPETGTR